MNVSALGYLGVDVADTDSWQQYAQLLGTMTVPLAEGDGFGMKIDGRAARILIHPAEGGEGLAYVGWEVRDKRELAEAAARLEQAGYAVKPSSEAERAVRQVRDMVRTTDPGGFAVEVFWGPILDHRQFVSPVGVSGFVTGDMGLGHIVLGTTNLAESIDFYTNVMGFRVSDIWRPADEDVVFTRCNPRHHSLALVGAPESTLYHFMLEAATLDDVGYTLDRHAAADAPLSMGLGKHTNDRMVSFYSRSPSGFDVEFGFGGIRVDDDTWVVSEITQPSLWGHRRSA